MGPHGFGWTWPWLLGVPGTVKVKAALLHALSTPSDKQPSPLCVSRTTLRATWQLPPLCPPCYALWPTSCLSTGRSPPSLPCLSPPASFIPSILQRGFHLKWWSPKLEPGSSSLPCSLQMGAGARGSNRGSVLIYSYLQ